MQFYKLAPGARFEFPGRQFTKIAMSMAQDEKHEGNVFQAGTEVTPIGEPLLLPEEVAERWKPLDIPWYAHMELSPWDGGPPGPSRQR
jgi:hypothetical protein